MLEAVGERYWPVYFDKLRQSLTDTGIAVLQVITIAESLFAAYRRRPDFIQRYIFPGGMLPTRGYHPAASRNAPDCISSRNSRSARVMRKRWPSGAGAS